jgi:hypothetical protein
MRVMPQPHPIQIFLFGHSVHRHAIDEILKKLCFFLRE